ncbi:TetR/AcrR family transcriptional regulator [bacterium]|nr:TetR/AcrR family transcriptional regulator [bacterium]
MKNRDKETTKQKLIDAVGEILREQGFQGIGINAVAKKAGVDKVLIYRYFESLDGLLKEYVSQEDYFTNLQINIGEEPMIRTLNDALEVGKKVFSGQIRQALGNIEEQEILLWELSHKNHVTETLAQAREKQGTELMLKMSQVVDFTKMDLPAMAAVITGGINYLVLRSRTVDVYNGVDLRSKQGWERIEKAIDAILDVFKQENES